MWSEMRDVALHLYFIPYHSIDKWVMLVLLRSKVLSERLTGLKYMNTMRSSWRMFIEVYVYVCVYVLVYLNE